MLTDAQRAEGWVEELARVLCIAGGFDPDDMMANDGPRWRYYTPGATAILPIIERARIAGERAGIEAAAKVVDYAREKAIIPSVQVDAASQLIADMCDEVMARSLEVVARTIRALDPAAIAGAGEE